MTSEDIDLVLVVGGCAVGTRLRGPDLAFGVFGLVAGFLVGRLVPFEVGY